MATTASELIGEARYELNDLTAGREPAFTDTELLVYVNDGVEQIGQWVYAMWPYYWIRTAQTSSNVQNIVAGQASYDLPADCYGIIGVKLGSSDGDEFLNPLSLETRINTYADGYYLENDRVVLYATPATSVTNGLTVYYVQRPSRLASLHLNVPVPDEFRGLLKTYVVLKARARKEEKVADFGAIYAQLRVQLSALIRRTNVGLDASGLHMRWRSFV